MNTDIRLIDRLRKTHRLPADPETPVPVSGHGAERVGLVIDISPSMSQEDYPPCRYIAAIQAAVGYIEERARCSPSDIATLVLFCETARVVAVDASMAEVRRLLEVARRAAYGNGTDIKEALEATRQALSRCNDQFVNRIVLLTDGETLGDDPIPIAKKLKAEGVVIDVIGIAGSRSEVNESCLKKIASVVNGELRYRFIGDKKALLNHFRTIATDLVMVR